jgi:hypothetical protein
MDILRPTDHSAEQLGDILITIGNLLKNIPEGHSYTLKKLEHFGVHFIVFKTYTIEDYDMRVHQKQTFYL